MADWERQARLDLEQIMSNANLTQSQKTSLTIEIDEWADKLKDEKKKKFKVGECKVEVDAGIRSVKSVRSV